MLCYTNLSPSCHELISIGGQTFDLCCWLLLHWFAYVDGLVEFGGGIFVF